jgi:hypothetical protein
MSTRPRIGSLEGTDRDVECRSIAIIAVKIFLRERLESVIPLSISQVRRELDDCPWSRVADRAVILELSAARDHQESRLRIVSCGVGLHFPRCVRREAHTVMGGNISHQRNIARPERVTRFILTPGDTKNPVAPPRARLFCNVICA